MADKCIVTYRSFHPLEIAISCPEKEWYSGEISIRLVDVQIKLFDLSMGIKELEGAGAYSTSDMQVAVMNVDKVEVAKLYGYFVKLADNFEDISKTVREMFKEKALLGDHNV